MPISRRPPKPEDKSYPPEEGLVEDIPDEEYEKALFDLNECQCISCTPYGKGRNCVKKIDKDKEALELAERRAKRIAVIEKHKVTLDASIVGKPKYIRFRKYFHSFVTNVAYEVFESEEKEYQRIGRVDRREWSDGNSLMKSYRENEPMVTEGVLAEIFEEFGCYNY